MDDSSAGALARLRDFGLTLLPAPVSLSSRERLRVVLGSALGLALAAAISHALADPAAALPWLVAPLGATTVLVFAAPASPMAQPWAAVVGNTVSALVGILCTRMIADPVLAPAAAVSLAIAAMFVLRCMHPPGGAVALTTVLTHVASFRFALFPVLANTAVLVGLGILWHRANGRRYPHSQQAPLPKSGEIDARFNSADLDSALQRYNEMLDISRDDLEALLRAAELNAYRRLLGDLRCADIMSREVCSVEFGSTLGEAWTLMRQRGLKALPVLDRTGRIIGIVTRADFLREANVDTTEGVGARIRTLLRTSGSLTAERPEVVGQIMTRRVRVAREERHVLDLVAAFSEGGHHHLPVVDAEGRAVGMITQSDLVRALARTIPQTL